MDQTICHLEYLDLSSNQISDFTGEKLALIMKKNNILKHLNVADNLLKDLTGQRFELILDTNKTLTYLNLELNSIRSNFVQKISQKCKANKANIKQRSLMKCVQTKKKLEIQDFKNNEVILNSIN